MLFRSASCIEAPKDHPQMLSNNDGYEEHKGRKPRNAVTRPKASRKVVKLDNEAEKRCLVGVTRPRFAQGASGIASAAREEGA